MASCSGTVSEDFPPDSDAGPSPEASLPLPDAAEPQCRGPADCDDGDDCTKNSCVDGRCELSAEPKGTSCSKGVCSGETGEGSCVACVDAAECGGATPRCHLPLNQCVTVPLRAMSFNIRVPKPEDGENSWSNRKALVAKVISDHDPDVVGMQEVQASQRQDLLAALPSMAAHAVVADQWGNENVVLYRADRLTLVAKGTYWLSPTPDVELSLGWDAKYPRNCLWNYFERKSDGLGFYVYATHFDHEGVTARLESAKLLARKIGDRLHDDAPVVLVGDLNASETSAPIKALKKTLADTFRVLHPTVTDVGTFNGFTGERTGAKIDYVLVSPTTITERAEIIYDNVAGQYPSDHYPVSARISFR